MGRIAIEETDVSIYYIATKLTDNSANKSLEEELSNLGPQASRLALL